MRELTNNLLEEITQRLIESIHSQKIYLFGSQAAGRPDEDSDLDLLAVVKDSDRSSREIALQGRRSLWGLQIPLT